MSTDFEDKEREFLETLKADTGQDLGEWMSAISAQGLPHRNDVIDWLRQQGFIFSRASWLERIHANDGQPIYLSAVPESLPQSSVRTWTREGMSSQDGAASKPSSSPSEAAPPRQARPAGGRPLLSIVRNEPRELKVSPTSESGARETILPDTTGQPSGPAVAPRLTAAQMSGASGTIATPDQSALNATIARAKAYAPLTGFLLRRIAGALPEAIAVAARDHISLYAGDASRAPFAVLSISSRELRLALAGIDAQDEAFLVAGPVAGLIAGRLTGGAQAKARDMTCYVSLSDARQLDDPLIALISRAYSMA